MAKEPPTFIDLFAGIGGFHEALHRLGAECVMACERDKYARITYQAFHRKKVTNPDQFFSDCNDVTSGLWRFPCDITKVTRTCFWGEKRNTECLRESPDKQLDEELDGELQESLEHIRSRTPEFSILCAGFPCQPFSQSGKRLGFNDTRGTLFHDVSLMIRAREPGGFFLENVRGLVRHDYKHDEPITLNGVIVDGVGSTLGRILNILFSTDCRVGLGYHYPKFDKKDPRCVAPGVFLVRASDHSLPQHRPRIFIIGFKSKLDADRFEIPTTRSPAEDSLAKKLGVVGVFMDDKGEKSRKIGFTLRCGGKQSPIVARQNWDSYYVIKKAGGAVEPMRIEWEQGLRLQGFAERALPDGVKPAQGMKQLGNSVAVPAIKAWGKEMLLAMGFEIPEP
jgi:DNA (cytosine-5)-methyltransferase 1